MPEPRPSPIAALLAAYRRGESDPARAALEALARSNSNAGRNTYIAQDRDWTLAEARSQTQHPGAPLFGIPVALKDCFDLQGFPTSIGSKFYAARIASASADSAVAARLRASGSVITGKTHLHQLAYGITGENRDYGDCLQPRDPALLTGGSSSGSAAAVQEGSALAAIGTDTGGSVRAPAALCGLAGYRSSLGVGNWSGGYHLAESFDTIGWLFRDLRDAPLLAEALFDLPPERPAPEPLRIGVLTGAFRNECDAAVCEALDGWRERLARAATAVEDFPAPEFWFAAWDIYAPIQAKEAARIHAGLYHHFQPDIAARLEWGASLPDEQIHALREQHARYRAELAPVFRRFDCVLAPITPVSRLLAGADNSNARALILRHTTPASLGGLPAVVLPAPPCGVQLMGAHNDDRRLLRLAARLGELLARDG